jgi:hypothetical protein
LTELVTFRTGGSIVKKTAVHSDALKLLDRIKVAIRRLRGVNAVALGRREWRLRAAVREARAGRVRIDLAEWYGRALTVAERRRAHRLIEQLVAAGKLQKVPRYRDYERRTFVELPPPALRRG